MGLLSTLGLAPLKVPVGAGSALPDTPPPPDAQPVQGAQGEGDGKKGPDPKADYELKRDAAQKLLDALNAHAQKAHVAVETAQAAAELLTAKGHADASEWPKAMAEVEKARKTCVAGKGFADKFGEYVTKRAEIRALITAASVGGLDVTAGQALAAGADTKAAAPTRNYKGGLADLDKVSKDLGGKLKKWYVDDTAPKIKALKSKKATAFITGEIAEAEAMHKQVSDAIKAKQWRKAHLTGTQLYGRIAAADHMAEWRQSFEAQRPKTLAAIKKLKAKPALAGQGVLIDKRLEAADKMASKEEMQTADGVAELGAIESRCAAMLTLADSAAAYAKERKPADDAFAALQTHKAAKQIDKEIAAIRQQLASAELLAGDAGAGKPRGVIKDDPTGQNFEGARIVIKQAVSDLAAAKKVADGLNGVVDAQAAAGAQPPDDKALKKAVADLRKEAAAARKSPQAALAKTELDNCDAALKEVDTKIADKQPDVAAQVLIGASLQLVAARKILVEHTRYIDLQKALEKRRKALLPDPVGTQIKPKLDALQLLLDQATAHDKAGAFAEAAATVHQGDTAAKDAEAASVARKAYNDRSAKVQKVVDHADYAAIKVDQDKLMADALAKADGFDFAAAGKLLDTVENRVEAAKIEKLAKDKPGDKKLLEACKKMLAKGGAAEVDALIQRLPDDVDKSVIEKIAKERFGGIEIVSDDGAGAQVALKQMCKLMTKVPPDVVKKNPSLKKIKRVAAGGASYSDQQSEVEMNKRPGIVGNTKADFPSAAGRLPDREEDCKPANDNPEDIFDFNMLHELAHAIDDASHFMAGRENQADYGGWVSHGGKVEDIATAVADWYKFNANAEERQYVLDLVLGNTPVVPPKPAVDGDKWEARKKKVDDWIVGATTNNVWSNQALSEAIKIDKRIYHRAYTNSWVSYAADARKRGITGYQFRAPGEWFAELFAAFKLGKLKPSHPSAGWLAKIST